MEYIRKEIKNGITAHIIKTESFKTDLMSVFLTTKLTRDTVTDNALIPMVLRKGSSNLTSTEEINKHLDEMYGAELDCGVDKTGDNHVLKFYIETIDNAFLPTNEDLLADGLTTLLNIVFAPKTDDAGDAFDKTYVSTEKDKLKILIEGKKDNKAMYASLRCQEEMFEGVPFGLFKYGYIEDLDGIDEKSLYEYYKKLISECKIDIFISGNVDENEVIKEITENDNIKKLEGRDAIYNQKNMPITNHGGKEIIETADVVQGNLVIGLAIDEESKKEKYVAIVYNAILGGSATSKMFQIVREKHSLAYTASSSFLRHKNVMFIRCGIEIENYQKTLDLIKEQISDMEKGKFSDEDIANSKIGIIQTIKSIPEEQDTSITYYYGQEVAEHKMSFEEYQKEVEAVTREDIVEFAKHVSIDTIYFLKNE